MFEIAQPGVLTAHRADHRRAVTADGGELLLTRRLYASGRSSVSLNGNPITLGMLKQVAEHLVDVHGQHDHQFLLKPSNQLDVLDQFGEPARPPPQYHDVYEKLQSKPNSASHELSADRTLREQQLSSTASRPTRSTPPN